MKRGYIIVLLLAFVIAVIVFSLFYKKQQNEETNFLGHFNSETPLGTFRRAAVVSDSEHCAEIGRKLLDKNGTAMDAAIGTLLCMGVTIPQSMGLGGGCFITFYNRTSREAKVIDAREAAPLAATEDMYDGNSSLSSRGPLSIAIPGELAGYAEGHRRFGRLPWSELFEGAILLAEDGFEVGDHLENALKRYKAKIEMHNVKEVFLKSNGKTWKAGELLKRPDLARTFRRLAEEGAESFYSGSVMKDMVADLTRLGSIITEQDFIQYRPRVYDALAMKLGETNLTMFSVRPPGSGPLLGYILSVMSGYSDLYPKAQESSSLAALFYHRLIETFKFAYAKRMGLGDEQFDDVADVMANLTDSSFAERTRKLIDDDRTFEQSHYGAVSAFKDDHGTAHVSVIDAEGNAVSVGSTVNLYLGSMVMSNSTGIVFNDEMDDFALPGVVNFFGLPPSRFNRIEPKKRPLSSMCPAVIVDTSTGSVRLAIGGAGGTKITSAAALVAIRILLFNETIKEAIDAPRIHNQLFPDDTVYDPNFSTEILTELVRKGHKIKPLTGRHSVIIGIARTTNRKGLQVAYDWKKKGSFDGY